MTSTTAEAGWTALSKRPVAFRVPRTVDAGTAISSTEYRLFVDEDEAHAEAEALGVDYEALFLVGDRRPAREMKDQISNLVRIWLDASPRPSSHALAEQIDKLVAPAPFYGAQCPSYPHCAGGCGLGCTHQIECSRDALAAAKGAS